MTDPAGTRMDKYANTRFNTRLQHLQGGQRSQR